MTARERFGLSLYLCENIMFTVQYDYRSSFALPILTVGPDVFDIYEMQKRLKFRVISEDEWDSLLLADNLDDLVQFKLVEKGCGKNWNSREGVFNTPDESIAIVSVVCANWKQHFKLPYIQRRIKEAGLDINFFKVEIGGEVYYIPYETVERQNVIEKLEKMHQTKIVSDLCRDGRINKMD